MADRKRRIWPMILGVAGVILLIAWMVSGHIFTGIAGLILLLAMGGGALPLSAARPAGTLTWY